MITEPWQIMISLAVIYLLIGVEFFIVMDRMAYSRISWTEKLDEVAMFALGWPLCLLFIAILALFDWKADQ